MNVYFSENTDVRVVNAEKEHNGERSTGELNQFHHQSLQSVKKRNAHFLKVPLIPYI